MSEKIEDILRDEVLRALIPEERERLTQALDSQDTLGESEECFFKAFHGNPDSYTITDLKTGELVEVNTGFESMLGYSKSEVIGRTSIELNIWADPDERDRVVKSLEEEGIVQDMEVYFRKKSGEPFLTDLFMRPIEIKGEQHILSIARDITEKKKAEEELQKYRALTDQANDAIYIIDAVTGRFLDVNKTASMLTQYTIDELLNMYVWDIEDVIPDDHQWEDHVTMIKTRGGELRLESQHVRKDGTLFPVEVNLGYVKDLDQEYVVAVSREMTERKIAEQEKHRLMESLFHSRKMEAVGRLAGGVAHDFNNRLLVILGYARLAKDESSIDEIRQYLDEIVKAGNGAARTVAEILQISRKSLKESKPVDISAVVSDTYRSLQPLLNDAVVVDIKCEKDELFVLGDKSNLEDVLTNLAKNSLQAMPDGGRLCFSVSETEVGITISRKYQVEPGKYICIDVTDTGTGIEKDAIGKIFEPFYTTKKTGKGTGLGLARVDGLVKSHNGYLEVKSQTAGEERGTTFSLYFPSYEGEIALDEFDDRLYRGKGELILVVDDLEQNRNLLKLQLERIGYQVATADDGKTAIEYLTENPDVSAVVLDKNMIAMDGVKASSIMKRDWESLPIVMVTGSSAGLELDKTNVDDFLQKPYKIDRLSQILYGLIGND